MRVLLAVTFLAAALSARCGNSGDPVQAYLDFQSALRKGEAQAAWAGLSSDTRAALEKRSHEVSEASGGAIKDDPQALFFGAASRSQDVTEVKLIDRQGERATLSARAGDRAQVVKLVKEADGWKVDLTDSLRP